MLQSTFHILLINSYNNPVEQLGRRQLFLFFSEDNKGSEKLSLNCGGKVVLGFKPSVSDSKTLALSIRKTQDYLTNIRDQILCFLYYRLWQDFNWEKKDITSLHFMHWHKRKMHFLIFSLHICFLDRKCLNVITLPWLFHMIICFRDSQKSLNTFQQLVWGGENACFVYSIRSLSNP